MQRLFVGEAPCLNTQARYYLLEGGDPVSYGVAIEWGEETETVMDLSPSRRRVQELAETLARGVVTPVALRDVVDDWLLE